MNPSRMCRMAVGAMLTNSGILAARSGAVRPSRTTGGVLWPCSSLGASRLFTIGRVMLPAAIPQIMVGLRLGFGLAWLSLIAAEMVAASDGLGFMIADGRELLQTQIVMAGMIVIGVLGYMFNRLFVFAEHKLRAHEL